MPTTDREALLENAARCQAEALGLLADEAADAGDAELEAGYRWLVDNHRWPSRASHYWYWSWGVAGAAAHWTDVSLLPFDLPPGPYPRSEDFGAVLEWGARIVGRWLATGSNDHAVR